MATIIEQYPLENSLAQYPTTFRPIVVGVGQDVIFAVSNIHVVSQGTKVKFVAKIYISNETPSMTTTELIGTFKTTPNNAGVGIFDLSSVIENYVKAENLAYVGSRYKNTDTTEDSNLPMHLINQFSRNAHTLRYMAIEFSVEQANTTTGVGLVNQDPVNSLSFILMNSYLKYSDELTLTGVRFNYTFSEFALGGISKRFLTNAPTTQYANEEDYGTFGILNPVLFTSDAYGDALDKISIICYNAAGGVILAYTINNENTTGGYSTYNQKIYKQVLYIGAFPGNLRQSNGNFDAEIIAGNMSYYTVQALNISGAGISSLYTINIDCPTLKGYEPIRLTWLNQWGTWDYYTFNKKSSKTLSTKGSTYNQLQGSWNEAAYRMDSFKGGKKSFRVNTTETIKMNTDFVNEDNNESFEDLMNSPEIYILQPWKATEIDDTALNAYITPVRLVTKKHTTKTVANDKLIQYTFEVEKCKTLRTQSI